MEPEEEAGGPQANLRTEDRVMSWVYDDGGIPDYSNPENLGYCVCRAIAIATQRPVLDIWEEIEKRVPDHAYLDVELTFPYIRELGFKMHGGCRWRDLPTTGRLLVYLSHTRRWGAHLLAVIDGVAHDRINSWRSGKIAAYWLVGG
jgi:hypothetical protein